MQCLSIQCDGVAGGVLQETLDLRQETKWYPRYFRTSDVQVLRQSCAHTQGLGQTSGDVKVYPWLIWELPVAVPKDNGHLSTSHTRQQILHSELVLLGLQTVKHKTDETDGAE